MKKLLYLLIFIIIFVVFMIISGLCLTGCNKESDSIVNNSDYKASRTPSINVDTLVGGFIKGYSQGRFLVDTMENNHSEDPRYWSVTICHYEKNLCILDLFDESWFSDYMGLWPTHLYGGYAPLSNNKVSKNSDYFFIVNYYDDGARFAVFFIPAGSMAVERLVFPNNVYLGGEIVDIKQSKLNPRYYLLTKYYYWNQSTYYYCFDVVTKEITFLGD